jgi:CRISPR system Cascade subunit CasC
VSARYIDIHLLHTVPYANLNRDDLGSPKSVRFGYAERTRVSSQCWKRAVRLALEEASGEVAMRTRRVPLAVAARLLDRGWAAELAKFAGQQLAATIAADGLKLEKTGETSVLLYLPGRALDELVDICVEHRDELARLHASPSKSKKGETGLPRNRINAIMASRNGIINLFGRMLAELPSSNVDGAVQVAHAFTTHDTDPEVDFFTAVDDLNKAADETGSGHMNNAEFSAGTFYRYASVNLADLTRNLDGDRTLAAELAADFLSAFITAMPGAKKNSTAPFTVPDLAYIAVRADRPVSLASAFEAPVRAHLNSGYAEPSRRSLDDYAGHIYRLLGTDGLVHHAYATVDDKDLGSLGHKVPSYPALLTGAIAQAGLP